MRGRASVEIAKRALESRGLNVMEESVRIRVEGFDVGEVDLLARGPHGELYAVEVKAGQASPSDVKLLYANSVLLNAKPLLVARALSKEAEALAAKLGVELLELCDLLVVDQEELYNTVKGAVEDAVLNLLAGLKALGREEAMQVLEAIAKGGSLSEAARELGVGEEELVRRLGELRKEGLVPPLAGLKQMKLYAQTVCSLKDLIDRKTGK
ncbi:MAG: YraN family protein [Thermofilaceae archaeon]